MTHDVHSMFTMIAGKAWRGTTEMVANPEILRSARAQVRTNGMQVSSVSMARPDILLSRAAAR